MLMRQNDGGKKNTLGIELHCFVPDSRFQKTMLRPFHRLLLFPEQDIMTLFSQTGADPLCCSF